MRYGSSDGMHENMPEYIKPYLSKIMVQLIVLLKEQTRDKKLQWVQDLRSTLVPEATKWSMGVNKDNGHPDIATDPSRTYFKW